AAIDRRLTNAGGYGLKRALNCRLFGWNLEWLRHATSLGQYERPLRIQEDAQAAIVQHVEQRVRLSKPENVTDVYRAFELNVVDRPNQLMGDELPRRNETRLSQLLGAEIRRSCLNGLNQSTALVSEVHLVLAVHVLESENIGTALAECR